MTEKFKVPETATIEDMTPPVTIEDIKATVVRLVEQTIFCGMLGKNKQAIAVYVIACNAAVELGMSVEEVAGPASDSFVDYVKTKFADHPNDQTQA